MRRTRMPQVPLGVGDYHSRVARRHKGSHNRREGHRDVTVAAAPRRADTLLYSSTHRHGVCPMRGWAIGAAAIKITPSPPLASRVRAPPPSLTASRRTSAEPHTPLLVAAPLNFLRQRREVAACLCGGHRRWGREHTCTSASSISRVVSACGHRQCAADLRMQRCGQVTGVGVAEGAGQRKDHPRAQRISYIGAAGSFLLRRGKGGAEEGRCREAILFYLRLARA